MPITTGALALGSTIIGGGGGGDTSDIEDLINDYAKGRIICDTSTMQVGDAVRVRSVTTNEYIDKTVTIVGGYLVFNVLCKDYYKICMLQGGGHQITITGYDSESYVDIQIFDGMIGTGLRVYSSITSGAPNDYNGTGINLYFDSNSNKWVLKSTGTIIYQNQQYTSGQTIEEWSGQVNISLEEIPTEIGGEYVEIGFGDLHRSNVLDKTTLGGIQGILNAHQESSLLAIGDEVDITVSGSPVTFQIGAINLYDSHEVIFVAKNIYTESAINSANGNMSYAECDSARPSMQTFYNNIKAEEKALIKPLTKSGLQANASSTTVWISFTDYVWIPNAREIDGTTVNDSNIPKSQFPIFATQANRIKEHLGTADAWWTCDGLGSNVNQRFWRYISNTGVTISASSGSGYIFNSTIGLLPCFRLTADS